MAVSQSLTVTQESQSITGNYSIVRIKWTSTQTGQSWNGYTRTAYYYVSVNGGAETAYAVSYTLPKYETKTIVNTTLTVYHTNVGAGSIKVRTWMDTDISAGVVEKSQSLTLTTIPRASSLSLSTSSVNVGSSITANISRNSSSFVHDVTFAINGTYYKTFKNQGTSCTFTIPESWYNYMSSSMSCTAYCYVTTRDSSGTQIGDQVNKSFTVKVPSSVKPTVGTITLDPTNISIDGTSYNYLVQGKNKLTISVSGCSAGTGSSIKSYTFSGPGISSTTTSTSASASSVSGSGTLKYTVTVTDTRGQSASKEATIYCYPYTEPTIVFDPYRGDSVGTKSDSGTWLHCPYTVLYSSINGKNKVSIQVYGAPESPKTIASNSTETSGTGKIELADSETTYKVHAIVTDSLGGNNPSRTYTIYGAQKVLNIYKDGSGVAIGKKSSGSERFECRWNATFDGDVAINGNIPGLLKETEFYTGSSAGTINKTLSSGDSLDNYKYLEIFYVDNNGNGHNSTRIYKPNGRKVDLSIIEPSDSTASRTYIRRTMYTIAGSGNTVTITPSSTARGYVDIDNTQIVTTKTDSNYIKIIRVVGYK